MLKAEEVPEERVEVLFCVTKTFVHLRSGYHADERAVRRVHPTHESVLGLAADHSTSYENPRRKRTISPRRLRSSTVVKTWFQVSSGNKATSCSKVNDRRTLKRSQIKAALSKRRDEVAMAVLLVRELAGP